jgi:hypothetical protein
MHSAGWVEVMTLMREVDLVKNLSHPSMKAWLGIKMHSALYWSKFSILLADPFLTDYV